MKTIIIAKQTDDVQLGHLFEHIYCTQLAEYFREHGLFAYVDYYLDGRAYHRGLVVIKLELYTPEALSHEAAVYDLQIALDDNIIAGGLFQILAEKYAGVRTYHNEKTQRKLRELSDAPWIRSDSSDSLDLNTNHLAKPAFTFMRRDSRHFGTLRQTISIDASYANSDPGVILPLFIIVSKALRNNLLEDIVDSFYYYSFTDRFVKSKDAYKDINIYHADKRRSKALTGEPDVAKELFDQMKDSGFVERLSHSLREPTSQEPIIYPNADEIMEKVGVFVGEKAWPQLATEPRIRDVLDHISVEFRFGGKTETVRF